MWPFIYYTIQRPELLQTNKKVPPHFGAGLEMIRETTVSQTQALYISTMRSSFS